jgi:hypothetical protein
MIFALRTGWLVLYVTLAPAISLGTVVTTIPTRDGLVVASDSRAAAVTSGSPVCDNFPKLFELNTVSRAVIAATGNALFAPPFADGTDLCDHLQKPGVFNLGIVAKDYMNTFKDPVTPKMISDLARHTRSAIEQRLAPSLKRGLPDNDVAALVVFAQYIPAAKTSVRAVFTLAVQNQKIIATKCRWYETRQSDKPICMQWGDILGDFIDRLPPTSAFTKACKTTDPVSPLAAVEAAKDLIQRATLEYPKTGGPVQAYLLGESIKPQPLTPETK